MRSLTLVLLLSSLVGAGEQSVLIPAPDLVPVEIAINDCACTVATVCRPVRVKDLRKVAPCSVPTQIIVCDPITCRNVCLTVCMPPACCAVEPRKSISGRKLTYDLGKHQVQVKFTHHEIVIDYDN